jgi:hypothetical protein
MRSTTRKTLKHFHSVDVELVKGHSMNATTIFFCVLIVLLATLLLHWMRRLRPRIAEYGTQRMCPSCGLITSRLKASCLECGKPLTAVVYSTSRK